MTDRNYTHVFFLLDRSGSMQGLKQATELGFDAYVKELQQAEGRCRVSLSQFDDVHERVFHAADVHEVEPLHLVPRGSTGADPSGPGDAWPAADWRMCLAAHASGSPTRPSSWSATACWSRSIATRTRSST